jgi:hypothetical protein
MQAVGVFRSSSAEENSPGTKGKNKNHLGLYLCLKELGLLAQPLFCSVPQGT